MVGSRQWGHDEKGRKQGRRVGLRGEGRARGGGGAAAHGGAGPPGDDARDGGGWGPRAGATGPRRRPGAGARGRGRPRQVGGLGRLATTLGMEVVGVLEQGRRDNAGYLGRGKREELGGLVEEGGAGVAGTDAGVAA